MYEDCLYSQDTYIIEFAEKYGLLFVPLQAKFDALNANAPAGYWLSDGVHPTPAGHAMIKEAWLEAFAKLENL